MTSSSASPYRFEDVTHDSDVSAESRESEDAYRESNLIL
jgi:hypothetical protein